MNVRKTIKTISSVFVGGIMLGATILGATALDFKDYPNQFIKDGKFDGLIVIGSTAQTQDVLGAIDIATSLQYSMKTETYVNVAGSGSSSVSLTGDVVEIKKSNQNLQLGDFLYEARSILTAGDMAMLEVGEFRNSMGSTTYSQYLEFKPDNGQIVYGKDNNDKIGTYLKFIDGKPAFTYKIVFNSGIESSIDGTDLTELYGGKINILGNEYTIVKGYANPTTNVIKLTLMGGQVTDILKEYATKTYSVNGIDYEITIPIISDSGNGNNPEVMFQVNGETTGKMREGSTYTLKDGTLIGVRSIMANEGSEVGGQDIVEFYIGSQKIDLYDTINSVGGGKVTVNDKYLTSIDFNMNGQLINDNAKITDMTFTVNTDSRYGDVYIGSGEGLRETLRYPEAMIGNIWDIRFEGLTTPQNNELKIENSGDKSYRLSFTNQENNAYNIDFVDNSNDNNCGFKFGQDDKNLYFMETGNYDIKKNDLFILNNANRNDNAVTKVIRYAYHDKVNKQLMFTDASGDGDITVVYETTDGITGTGNIISGGDQYKVVVDINTGNLKVDYNANGNIVAGDKIKVVINGGGIVDLFVGGTTAQLSSQQYTTVNTTIQEPYTVMVDTPRNVTLYRNVTNVVTQSYTEMVNTPYNVTLYRNETATVNNVTTTVQVPYTEIVIVPVNTTLYRNVSVTTQEPYVASVTIPINTTLYRSVTTQTTIALNNSCGASQAPNTFTMSLTTLGKHIDNGVDETILWDIYKTTDNKVSLGNLIGITTSSDNNLRTGTSKYGTFVTYDTENTPADLTFNYPNEQALGQVFVTGNKDVKMTNSTTSATRYATTVMNRLEVGKSVLDTAISDNAAQNMIVVGGPCVNSVAKALMGNKENCAEGFTPGSGIVRLVQSGNKVAMIVAGYSADDSMRTARFIANYDKQTTLKGGDYLIVDGNSVAKPYVAPAAPKPVAPAPVEASSSSTAVPEPVAPNEG